MKNNKGFTLVELLAVIAVLAILIIIALPNIMSLFNESKKNSFTNEAKTIFKAAQSQWMSDSMFDTQEKGYGRTKTGNCTNSLKLSGREEINYYIKLNKLGNVVEYYIEDGSYQYSYSGTGLKVEQIDNVTQIASINSSDVLNITCDGNQITNIATCATDGCNKTASGTKLKIGDEYFFVIGDGKTAGTKSLLAERTINTSSNAQVTSGPSTVRFSDLGYWDGCKYSRSTYNCTSSPEGLLSQYVTSSNAEGKTGTYSSNSYPYVYNENASVSTAVNAYANKIATSTGVSVTGRLMTYEEANGLSSSILNCSQSYWLGSAISKNGVWVVNYSSFTTYSIDTTSAIRPVLEISASAL